MKKIKTRWTFLGLAALLACGLSGCGSGGVFDFSALAQQMDDLTPPADIVPLERFVQLDLEVPFRPTVFPSGTSRYVTYELYLTNMIPVDYIIKRVEVVDADSNETVAQFEGSGLRELVRLSGAGPLDTATQAPVPLSQGQRAIVFFFLEIPAGETVPARIRHRVVVETPEGDRILNESRVTDVDLSDPVVLAPPMTGGPWLCNGAPGTQSYHRRTLLALDGEARVSQRYAIDFEVLTANGDVYDGDPSLNESYPAYGQPLMAAASGRVVSVVDGLPDNTPPETPPFTNPDEAGGNSVITDIGEGRYVVYGHIQPGSITVQVDDQVAVGQQIGLVGNSGNSTAPHLHIQVVDKPSFLGAQGLPWVLGQYDLVEGTNSTPVQNQLPLLDQVVDFGGSLQ